MLHRRDPHRFRHGQPCPESPRPAAAADITAASDAHRMMMACAYASAYAASDVLSLRQAGRLGRPRLAIVPARPATSGGAARAMGYGEELSRLEQALAVQAVPHEGEAPQR